MYAHLRYQRPLQTKFSVRLDGGTLSNIPKCQLPIFFSQKLPAQLQSKLPYEFHVMRLECVTRPPIWWIRHFYASTIFLVQGPSWRFMRILQAGRTSWAVKWREGSRRIVGATHVPSWNFCVFFCKPHSSWNAFLKREKITLVRDFPPFSEILSAYIELRGISGITNTPTWLADYRSSE